MCCCQYVKGKNFESNSQPVAAAFAVLSAVVNMSKVKISKAIHNGEEDALSRVDAVVNMSKVKISKAIHNRVFVVFAMSWLLSICQR